MEKRAGIQLAIISWLLACLPATAAVAQSTQRIGGSWFATDGKMGLVLKKGDAHPYFLYGECEKAHRHVRLQLEIEPKLLGDAIAREEYIVVRWSDRGSKVDSIVDRVFLNEVGKYGWSPSLTANLETVSFWLRASRLELTIGVREKNVFNARQTYLLPDEDRETALSSLIRFCFSD
jgi:hypothetical protein